MGLVLSFRVFQSVLSNITVMRKQAGTPKVHVSPARKRTGLLFQPRSPHGAERYK